MGEVNRYRYKNADLLIRGVRDFLKGIDWLEQTDAEALHKEIMAYGYKAQPVDQLDVPFDYSRYLYATKEEEQIASSKETPTFENTIVALDNIGEKMNAISGIFFNLNACLTDSLMQDIAQNVSPKLTSFSHAIYMNPQLFERVKQVHEQKATLNLNQEQAMLLENTWKAFIDGGANLEGADRERFKEISIELGKLSLTFDKNELAETNAFELHVTDEKDLSGLPEGAKEMAAMTAKQRGKEGWIFTLHYPSMGPLMKYADNRTLREKMYRANSTRAYKDNEYNNEEVVKKITALRLEKAKLMGYPTYANYALTDRMANTPEIVNNFISELHEASYPYALKDKKEVEDFARKAGLKGELQRWDWSYYSNKLMQEKYALDDKDREVLEGYYLDMSDVDAAGALDNLRNGTLTLEKEIRKSWMKGQRL